MNRFKITGEVIHIGTPEEVKQNFKKCELIIRADGSEPQEINFTAINQRINLLNGIGFRNEVIVEFMITGKKAANGSWYNNLILLGISKL